MLASPVGARDDRYVARAPSAKRASASVRALEAQVLADVNATRRQRGLRALRFSAGLSRAAEVHSRDMARRGYFSHNSANGAAFWRRVQRFYPSAGYRSWAVGENLVWASPDLTAASALSMWMGSPPHRANLLSRQWREVGLAAVHVQSAPGVFGGHPVTIVTANFGSRTR
ncbi:MAG: CAP domain-containing protein [Actinomycetota bacterium]|nr:CAP domain-containing protein [Actinomycetota bacterium]